MQGSIGACTVTQEKERKNNLQSTQSHQQEHMSHISTQQHTDMHAGTHAHYYIKSEREISTQTVTRSRKREMIMATTSVVSDRVCLSRDGCACGKGSCCVMGWAVDATNEVIKGGEG
jgi:hypothetical protein